MVGGGRDNAGCQAIGLQVDTPASALPAAAEVLAERGFMELLRRRHGVRRVPAAGMHRQSPRGLRR